MSYTGGKYINTQWKVVVGTTDLSDHAFDVQIGDESEKVEVSGFSAARTREYLQGLRDQNVTVQFRNDFGSNSVFHTLEPLYSGGSAFDFYVQPFSSLGTSYPLNPLYGGTAQLFSFPVGAALNEVGEITVEFAPSSNSTFQWGTVAP